MVLKRRRFLWHAAAGLWVGFAATFFIAPLWSEILPGSGASTALALLICTPLVSTLAGLVSALFTRSTALALCVTVAFAVAAALFYDVAIRVVAGTLNGVDLARALELSVYGYSGSPYLTRGGPLLIGAAFAIPLCAATWAARTVGRTAAGTRGALRNLVLVAGATATMGVPFARMGLGSTPMWPVITIVCVVGAIACVMQAASDLGVAVFLGRLLRQSDPRLAVARASREPPLPGIDIVASLSDRPDTGHVVLRRLRQYEGPGRISQETTPVLHLGAEPAVVRRSLRRGALILLIFAGTQCALAIGSAGLSLPPL